MRRWTPGRHGDLFRRQRRARAGRVRARRAGLDVPGIRRRDADGHGLGPDRARPVRRTRLPTAAASYGAVPAVTTGDGADVDCHGATGNCYRVQVSSPATRPAAHWDASVTRDAVDDRDQEVDAARGRQLRRRAAQSPLLRQDRDALPQRRDVGLRDGTSARTSPCPRSQMAIFVANALARGGANVPASGIWNGGRLFLRAGRRLALLRRRADGLLLQARALPRGAERDARLLGDALLSRRSGLAPRDGGLHREGNGGAGRGSGRADDLWSGSRDGPLLQLQRRRAPRCTLPTCPRPTPSASTPTTSGPGERSRAARRRTYCPAPPVKRGEMAKFLTNAMGLELYGP